jgi:hypothetical protein
LYNNYGLKEESHLGAKDLKDPSKFGYLKRIDLLL